MKTFRYLSIFVLLIPTLGFTQEFKITTIEQTPENLIVHYDLIDTTKDRTYTVYLYMNGTQPLQKVSEDAGFGVKPGENRKIVWAAKEELGADFKGAIELEVRGKIYIPFIEFEGFPEGKIVRRGKSYFYSWEGSASRAKILNFDLYQDGELRYSLPEVANTGSTELILPKSVKTGKYTFIISDSKNKDLTIESPTIIVKPKVPLVLKILPVALVGASYPFWPEGGGGGTPESDEIDTPPDPPTGQ